MGLDTPALYFNTNHGGPVLERYLTSHTTCTTKLFEIVPNQQALSNYTNELIQIQRPRKQIGHAASTPSAGGSGQRDDIRDRSERWQKRISKQRTVIASDTSNRSQDVHNFSTTVSVSKEYTPKNFGRLRADTKL